MIIFLFILRVCYNATQKCEIFAILRISMPNANAIIAKCVRFIQDELDKKGFKRAVLGLSGGLDSAFVAALATKAIGANNLSVLLMPSPSSSQVHFNDALNFATLLGLDTTILQLKPFVEAFMSMEGLQEIALDSSDKLRIGNFCARLRMALLYDMASARGAIVLGTSNKSEIMLGYGTIYGDLACGVNPIGGLYKSEIFALAKMLDVPEAIIAKKPSADLFANQSDEADLGYSYEVIDLFLKAFEALGGAQSSLDSTQKATIKERLIAQGFEIKLVESLSQRVWANAFKRQMPSILQDVDSAESSAK